MFPSFFTALRFSFFSNPWSPNKIFFSFFLFFFFFHFFSFLIDSCFSFLFYIVRRLRTFHPFLLFCSPLFSIFFFPWPLFSSVQRIWVNQKLSKRRTKIQNNQELGHKYWTTRLSVCSFAHTAHSFTFFALLALLSSFFCSLAHFFTTKLVGKWMIRYLGNRLFWLLTHSAVPRSKVKGVAQLE